MFLKKNRLRENYTAYEVKMGTYPTGSAHPYPYPYPQNFTRRVTRTRMRVKKNSIPVPAG
jgi:hypothetical protein